MQAPTPEDSLQGLVLTMYVVRQPLGKAVRKEGDMKVIAYNIQWDIDIDDAYERLDEMTAEKAAEELEIPANKYANMTTEERHDFAYDLWHHSPATLEEFMGLPDEVEIPEELGGPGEYLGEDIADWLSDTFGFCHKGFDIKHEPLAEGLHSYDVPFAYEMYGRITVEASSKEEAIKIAEEKLDTMTTQEMAENAEYLSDSEEIDEEGVFYEDGVAI